MDFPVASLDQLITSSSQPDGGEATMSEECANPLFLGWIKEWLDQARERNSKGVTVWVSRVIFALVVSLMPFQLQKSLRVDESMSTGIPAPISGPAAQRTGS